MIKRILLLALPFLFQMNIALGQNLTHLEAQDTTIVGELFFRIVSIGSHYDGDQESIKSFNSYLDSLERIEKAQLKKNEQDALDIFGELRRLGLLEKPMFHLKTDTASYFVYADVEAYQKIEHFTQQSLQAANKKVIIELTGDFMQLNGFSVIHCKQIIKAVEVEGQTLIVK